MDATKEPLNRIGCCLAGEGGASLPNYGEQSRVTERRRNNGKK